MEHGTVEMYRKELRDTTTQPCVACRAAQARYMADYRQTKGRDRTSDRKRARIRRRAVKRLIEENAGRMEELLAEESER